jgi:hypothetical protein
MSHATSRAFPLIVLLLGPVACDEGDGSDTTAGQACEGAKCDDVEGEPTGGGDGAGGTDQAQVRFSALRVDGPRVAGGTLSIEYDLERLTTCRATHNGSPFWDITAHALFTPGNQQVEGSVREITLEGSPPAQVVRPLAFEVEIPEDATAVQVWFRNFDGNGTCEDFDSANGQNHRFQVE